MPTKKVEKTVRIKRTKLSNMLRRAEEGTGTSPGGAIFLCSSSIFAYKKIGVISITPILENPDSRG
jgi:hypothetical protein